MHMIIPTSSNNSNFNLSFWLALSIKRKLCQIYRVKKINSIYILKQHRVDSTQNNYVMNKFNAWQIKILTNNTYHKTKSIITSICLHGSTQINELKKQVFSQDILQFLPKLTRTFPRIA